MQIERINSDSLVVNQLPDGSRLLVNSDQETILALNSTAAAAWDACSNPATLTELAENMQRSLNAEVPEELAEHAILELQKRDLVKTSGSPEQPSRRAFMAKVGMAAVPLVVSLTMAEQRAYAKNAASATPPPKKHHEKQPGPWDWR